VARGADALVLATEWNQFRRLDLQRIKELLKIPVFIDLRNVYDPDQMKRLGFQYTGVGR
jgi:UDPglucose 6-dehydrogenase